MKRYIRTKDKIYEVIEENDNYYKCCYNDERITLVSKFDNDAYGFSKALKESDTIEDLCDRFIVEYESGSFTIFNDFKDIERHFAYYPQGYHKVTGRYGVIFIKGRGLIYVAKINSEGELELL